MDFTKFLEILKYLNISKLIPESVKGFLNGNGTYVSGFVGILVSFLAMAGVDMTAYMVTLENAPVIFAASVYAIFMRRGIKNEVKKLGE
jgi:hypothetical protein